MAYNNLILRTLTSPFIGNTPDFTRKSVLSHTDVDSNFIFLKGEDIITGSTSGTSIILTQVNSDIIEIDILPILNCPDNFTTGSTLIGHSLYFDTKDSLSAYTVDLSPISGDTNTDNYTTGTTLVGKTIYYDRTDAASAFTTDLTSLFPATDYGNIIFVSEVGPTGLTRNDVVGNINLPVDINWASQIAQSGDTIHVKSGIYTATTTGESGLCVYGANHYFEPNSHVYKSTSGPMFSKSDSAAPTGRNLQANVYGSGSFYGSGSCGWIFYNFATDGAGAVQTYEWDICENSADACIVGGFNGDTVLRGKRRIISTGGDAIVSNGAHLTIDCPIIESTIGGGIRHLQGAGTVGSLNVNATEIIGAAPSAGKYAVEVSNHFWTDGHNITASYVNYVYANGSPGMLINLTLNVPRVDEVSFIGAHLIVNGHLGYLRHFNGISDIKLLDYFANAGTGVVNATINGAWAGNPANPIETWLSNSGDITHNLKLSNYIFSAEEVSFARPRWVTFSTGRINLLGDWNIDGWAFTAASGFLHIPSGTNVNIGPTPCPYFTTSAVFGFQTMISGNITERNLIGSLTPTPQSGVTTSPTIIGGVAGTILNGATIVVRNQDRQIMVGPTSGSTIKIYSGGLNTNKMDAFEAEQEKLRISVTGTSATLTVNTETFVSTTGATAAASAAELVALINASGTVAATASQDVPGVDTYIYIEADVAGDALTIGYGTNTLLDAIVRYNNKGVTDIVGGTLIEDPDISTFSRFL